MCFSQRVTSYTFLACGIVLAVGCSTLVAMWQSIFFCVLENKLIVAENSMSYGIWKETPFPIYLEIFLYNFTNSDEVLEDNSVKPKFEEMGPYVFSEHHIKVNKIWNSNGTVSFYQKRIYNYIPERSNGRLSDNITNINMIAVSASYSSRFRSIFEKMMLDSVLNLYGEGAVVTKTAGELLFDGYDDKLLSLIGNLNISGVDLPFDKFGWFYARNLSDTFDGLFNMHTGSEDIYKLGVIDKWNNENKVEYYDAQCAEVRGSAGELFPPGTDPKYIEIFATDICSYLTLNRNGSKEVKGIAGTLFSGDKSPFDNGDTYPEQACFCREGDSCPPPGTRNVSLCRMGAPAFISFPHFNLAHPSYRDRIDGIFPDERKDKFEMAVELSTGVPLYVKAQLQINILVQRIPGIKYFDKMPDNIYIPMLWFRQEVLISDDLACETKHAISLRKNLPILFYALSGLGIVLFIVGMIVGLWRITTPVVN